MWRCKCGNEAEFGSLVCAKCSHDAFVVTAVRSGFQIGCLLFGIGLATFMVKGNGVVPHWLADWNSTPAEPASALDLTKPLWADQAALECPVGADPGAIAAAQKGDREPPCTRIWRITPVDLILGGQNDAIFKVKIPDGHGEMKLVLMPRRSLRN